MSTTAASHSPRAAPRRAPGRRGAQDDDQQGVRVTATPAGRGPRPRLVRPLLATHLPPPEPSGDIGVLAAMRMGDRTQWLRVGVARVEPGLAGAEVLCVTL